MKKELFKHFMLVMLIAFMGVGMTSCGDDDDTPKEVQKELEGSWVFDHGTTSTMGYTISISRAELQKYAQQMGVRIWDETLDFKGGKVNGAQYVYDNGTFYFKDYADFKSTLEITPEQLKFTYDMSAIVGMQCTVVLYYSRR